MEDDVTGIIGQALSGGVPTSSGGGVRSDVDSTGATTTTTSVPSRSAPHAVIVPDALSGLNGNGLNGRNIITGNGPNGVNGPSGTTERATATQRRVVTGRGSHSSTCRLSLSRFFH